MSRFFFIKNKNINQNRLLHLKKNCTNSIDGTIFCKANKLNQNYSYLSFSHSKNDSNFFENEDFISIIDGTPHTQNILFGAKEFVNAFKKKSFKFFLNKLNGGFVGFIYDKKEKITYTFRDRFGLKPIYIYNKNGLLIVSSQADFIRQYLNDKIKINYQYLLRYAYCNYNAVYGREEIIYNDIQLQKLTSLYTIKNNQISKSIYWSQKKNTRTSNLTIYDYKKKIKHIFENMISNYVSINPGKKYAVALSGGTDSGLISGLLKKYFSAPDAVSLTYFENSDFNEEKLIKESVKKNINTWNNFKLTPKTLLKDLDNNYYRFLDAPLATVSIYGYDYLFRSASKAGYDLLFTGSGGDYIQSGNYNNYWYYLADLYLKKNKIFKNELNKWIHHHSTKVFPKSYKILLDQIKKKVNFKNHGELLKQDFVFDKSIINRDLFKDFSFLKSNQVKNYGTYLKSFMMQEYRYDVAPGVEAEDIMQWANKISVQSPFFDKEVAEFGWELPSNLKIKNGVNKYLYRKAFKDILPYKIVNRTAKSGFNAPFDQWARNELKEFIMDIFSSNLFKKRSIYNYKNFMTLVNSHMNEENNYMMLIWQALNVELFLRDKNI